jgi:serine protease Do
VAGIRRGDIIVSFNGIRIKESHELPAVVARTRVGERAKVSVIRDAQERSFTITIGELPSRPTGTQPSDQREDAWGMTVTNISPEIVRRFRFMQGQEGVVVIAVERDSSAPRAGVQVGDVIEEVNRQPIRSLEDFDKAMAAAKDGDRILLLTRRGDFSSYRVLRKRD